MWGDNLAIVSTNEVLPSSWPHWVDTRHDADEISSDVVDMVEHPYALDDRGWWGDFPGLYDAQHDGDVSGGIDTIQGGDGSDVLFGQSGADTLLGGAGDDWLIGGGEYGHDQVLDGGTGSDRISHGDDNSSGLRDLVAQLLTVWTDQFSAFGSAQGLVSPSPWIATYELSFSPHYGPECPARRVLRHHAVLRLAGPVSTPSITSAPANSTADFTVSGQGTAGELISLYDGATLIGTAIVSATGNWTIAVSGLALGAHTITAVQTDRITHLTSHASHSAVVKVFNATPPPSLAAPANVPVAFTITGSGVVGDTVWVYDGSTLVGKVKITAADGTWSLAVTLSAGSHTLSATEVDPVSTLVSDASASVAVNVIAVPPLPGLSAPSASAASVTVGGSCVAGDTVSLFDGGASLASILCTGGSWTWTGTLALGRHTLSASQTEPVLGLTSGTRSATVTVYAPPAAPTLVAPSAGGSPVTVSGTCVSGDTVTLLDGGTPVHGASTTCSRGGTWSMTVGLAVGSHTLTATQTDPVSGLASDQSAVAVTVVYAPPAAPTISVPWTSSSPVPVAGTGVPGDTITALVRLEDDAHDGRRRERHLVALAQPVARLLHALGDADRSGLRPHERAPRPRPSASATEPGAFSSRKVRYEPGRETRACGRATLLQ